MPVTTQASYGTPASKKMRTDHGSAPNSTPGTPQPSQSKAGTPVPTWNASQIPIDPALQQATVSTPAPVGSAPSTPNPQGQSSTPVPMPPNMPYVVNRNNYQHYTAYGNSSPYYHVPQYQFQPNSTPAYIQAPSQASVPPKASQQQSQQQNQQASEQDNNVDVSTLNDAIGVAGLDLKAEEENLQRTQDLHPTYRNAEDRSRKQPSSPAFDSRILGATMRNIGTNHKVSRIPDDSVNYLALALRARLQTLIEGMIAAANHRALAQFDREPGMYTVEGEDTGEDGEKAKKPMWNVVIRKDTRKILEVLERVEREEEMRVRRERRERLDAAEAAASQPPPSANSPVVDGTSPGAVASGTNGDDAGGEGGITAAAQAKKAKKKKDGPGVTARNMSEDVQKRLSNAVATQAAGLGRGKYAWMNAGGSGSGSAAAKPKKEPSKSTLGGPSSASAGPASGPEVTMSTSPATGAATGSQTQPAVSLSQTATATSATGSTWAKPYVSAAQKAMASSIDSGDEDKTVVTLRDAMFVIERERGHGGGRGAARAWV